MSATYVTSMLVMAALAVLVLIALVRSRRWYHYAPAPDEHGQVPALEGERRPPLLERPTTWIVGFVALMLGAVGGVFAFVTNPDAPAGLLSLPVLAVGGLMLGGYLLYGTYSAAKGRGHPSSIAAAETATLAGALFLVAVSAQLIG
ncbi:hypothetical protein OB920_19900 [Halobacteria archaeon HArc-gm2]|nr:hypothetical protein [Halobacteria archaeon HArc-gm2]